MGILWIQLFCQWQNIPGKVGCKTIHITGIDIFIKCQENVGIVMLKRTQTVVEEIQPEQCIAGVPETIPVSSAFQHLFCKSV